MLLRWGKWPDPGRESLWENSRPGISADPPEVTGSETKSTSRFWKFTEIRGRISNFFGHTLFEKLWYTIGIVWHTSA